MEKFFITKNNPEFNAYYKSEDIQNTDFVNYDYEDYRRPDALIGFTNDVFLYPPTAFNNVEEEDELSMYD